MFFFSKTVGVSSTSFIVVDLGILGLASTFARFFFSKEGCKSFFTTFASVPVRDWTSRPSLTLDEICVFRKPSELGWNRLELGRKRAEFGGTFRTRTARVITNGLGSLHRLARATITFASDHSHQKPRSSNWLKFSRRIGFLVRVLRAPRRSLSRRPIPLCSRFRPVPTEAGSAWFRLIPLCGPTSAPTS